MGKTLAPHLVTELERLYAEVPSVACQRRCGTACGPVILTDLEAQRLRLATHTKPRTLPMAHGSPGAMRCVYLAPDQRRCTVYAIRPLICRVWGAIKRLSCPFGCVPDRWLSDHEFLAIAQAVERLGGGRVLRTDERGLGHIPGESFGRLIDTGRRLPAAVEAEAERVRGLRAIHGGRILVAMTDDEREE
jgi:hypothetical protein